jgi:hypothetical protein
MSGSEAVFRKLVVITHKLLDLFPLLVTPHEEEEMEAWQLENDDDVEIIALKEELRERQKKSEAAFFARRKAAKVQELQNKIEAFDE